MGAGRTEILRFLDEELRVERYHDYGPNGLQVAGILEVERVAVAVSSTLDVFERAAAWGASMLIVHHGLFWNPDSRVIDDLLRRRLQVLFDAGITLAAYHLPLDGHPVLGNNAQLAAALDVAVEGWFLEEHGPPLALYGRIAPLPAGALAALVRAAVAREPQVFGGGPAHIERVGICSGGAARTVRAAAALGLDAFISGEPEEDSRALSLELGITFLAAGHHATETFGVRALARLLEERFDVETCFLDVPNPV
jgi:dinuclear metal center YbgI/SA1388 family protein